jgi:predicted ArsR family transcriptional regulator
MRDAAETWTSHVSAIAALDEPTRRRLYEFVVREPEPVSRDQAAEVMEMPRTTVAFHLDKLVAEGLLRVVYERRTGRSGPGAGRPSKLYRRSAEPISVTLPERRYELAARLLAVAVEDAEGSTETPRTALQRRAHELGKELGEAAQATRPADEAEVLRALHHFGYEPRQTDDAVVLVNCPFHNLAQDHTELVCGMNLRLVDGLLEGLEATELTAELAPQPGYCCVRLR